MTPNTTINKRSAHIFVILISAFAFFFSIARNTPHPVLKGNEGSHIGLVYSIVFRNSLSLVSGPADASFFQGKYYSNKPPGYAFSVVPAYVIYNKLMRNELDLSREEQEVSTVLRQSHPDLSKEERKVLEAKKMSELILLIEKQYIFEFLKLFNALLSALSVVLAFLLLTTFNLSLPSIYLGIIAAFLGTIFPAYGAFATSIPLSVFMCLLAVLAYRLHGTTQKRRFFLISTVCISYASIVDYSNSFFLIPMVVLLVKRIKDDPKLILFSIPSLIPILVLMVYNYQIFEKCFVLSYSYYSPPAYVKWENVSHSMSLSNIPSGLCGLLISASRGMFIISPITLFGILGLFLVKKIKPDLLLLFIMSVSGIVIASSYSLWHGGHCIGYRHILIPAITLGFLSSFFYEHASKYLRVVAVIILILSCATGILSLFIQSTPDLLMITWAGEPESIHSSFYSELLFPLLFR